tara:strand:+ start:282 stop:515 length:234 start_codon:yes stop_codon:yes gene_type:complete
MKNILKYIKNLILSDSKESSKRFIMLVITLLIIGITIAFITVETLPSILITLCGFVLALAGVASWQSNKQPKNQNDE